MATSLKSYTLHTLSLLLGANSDDLEPIFEYLVTYQNAEEISSYLQTLVGDSPEALEFIEEFVKRRFQSGVNHDASTGDGEGMDIDNNSGLGYSDRQSEGRDAQSAGSANSQNQFQTLPQPTSTSTSLPSKKSYSSVTSTSIPGVSSNAVPSLPSSLITDDFPAPSGTSVESLRGDIGQAGTKNRKEKKKKKAKGMSIKEYENFLKRSGGKVDEGRINCGCQASKHDLLTNCLSCGRVICMAEGPGPCLFCGTLVLSAQQQIELLLQRQRDNTGIKSRLDLPDQIDNALADVTEKLQKAEENKNRLLDYQRSSAQRTKVYDAASDFYSPSQDRSRHWLSKDEQQVLFQKEAERIELLKEREIRSGKGYTITLDLQGKKVMLDDSMSKNVIKEDRRMKPEADSDTEVMEEHENMDGESTSTGLYKNPNLDTTITPKYIPGSRTGAAQKAKSKKAEKLRKFESSLKPKQINAGENGKFSEEKWTEPLKFNVKKIGKKGSVDTSKMKRVQDDIIGGDIGVGVESIGFGGTNLKEDDRGCG
ncbi:hypothetical protein BKA69DRAFT_1105893 [Paraphysoderma sedebokerense]|nr:hypothetical protein BKA69DRAFT_1105893 [Paraphysoderma sedebokerense]